MDDKGRIVVRGKLHTRAKHKRADYVLFYKPNIPLAIIEAKDNNHSIGDGMQQGLGYAEMLQVPFVFSSNGDGFLFHNKIATDGIIERELALDEFPAVEALWQWWAVHRGLDDRQNNQLMALCNTLGQHHMGATTSKQTELLNSVIAAI
jgi:type I restriction enzyme R subunit